MQEMRQAALLAKAVARDAEAMPAQLALRCATLGGAIALGLDRRIGSIVPGKLADLVAVRLHGPELTPCFDPVSHLVYAAGREHVSDVWVAGKQQLQGRELLNPPMGGLDTRYQLWQNALGSRPDS
jgi:5-methylthioadenosine/S-adenosylhomocysteine deaminase